MEVRKNDDSSEKKGKRKTRLPRERLLHKIEANKEHHQQIYEMQLNAYLKNKLKQIKNLQQKEPNLAERILQKKMVETRVRTLESIYFLSLIHEILQFLQVKQIY